VPFGFFHQPTLGYELSIPRKQAAMYWLVVWNMNFMNFHVLGIIIPSDLHIFQRGRYTTNQLMLIDNGQLALPHGFDGREKPGGGLLR
jgi:hypothetical protein